MKELDKLKTLVNKIDLWFDKIQILNVENKKIELNKFSESINKLSNYDKHCIQIIIKCIKIKKTWNKTNEEKYISEIKIMRNTILNDTLKQIIIYILQKKIYNYKRKLYYINLTLEQRKYNRNKKINKFIENHGLEAYKNIKSNYYKKWYSNLSIDKINQLKEYRKKRYNNLPSEKKLQYKLNKINNINLNKEQQYNINKIRYNKRKDMILKMFNDDSEKYEQYINKLKKRKRDYFNNLPENKKKFLNKKRTEQRKLNRKQIDLDEYNKNIKNITEEYQLSINN